MPNTHWSLQHQDCQFVPKLKQHHHIKLDPEFKYDCQVWLCFLKAQPDHVVLNRSMIDVISPFSETEILRFYSDASASKNLGFGCIFESSWIAQMWEPGFITECEPSIEYLELYALVEGVLTWSERLWNRRAIIFCDNISVVFMVNNNSSSCRQCMTLLRMLVLSQLIHNTKILVKFVSTKKNGLADVLS